MFSPEEYSLLDFGAGRRLEQFGPYIIDRPSPVADGLPRKQPERWKAADARYRRTSGEQGKWTTRAGFPEAWTISPGEFTLELKLTKLGQLGIFAEQAENWDWIHRQVQRGSRPLKVLNLFAYTGGSTLAAASAGAEVVHLDSSKTSVTWARRNAKLSGLEDAPIRWMVEDSLKFVQREVRRGQRYHAVILDPPSYGHGPKGQAWKLKEDLMPLLRFCGELMADQRAFFLLSCHTPGFGPAELEAMVSETLFGHCQAGVVARSLSIRSANGQPLSCGAMVRWPSK